MSQHPVQAIFLTYPSNVFIYHAANEVTRRFGRSTSRPWWDLTPHFLALCGSETTQHCDEYFLSDQHPTPKGHEAAAAWIATALRQRLAGAE